MNTKPLRGLSSDAIEMYQDAKQTYDEAQANINRNGAVVAHPRTGAPIENPYLKVRERATKTLLEIIKSAKPAKVWAKK